MRIKDSYRKAASKNQQSIDAISICSFDANKGEVNSRFVNLKFIDNQDFINDNDDPDVGRTFEGPTNQFGVPQQIKAVDNGLRSEGSTIKVTRKPTHRLKTTIAMYMPSSVQG